MSKSPATTLGTATTSPKSVAHSPPGGKGKSFHSLFQASLVSGGSHRDKKGTNKSDLVSVSNPAADPGRNQLPAPMVGKAPSRSANGAKEVGGVAGAKNAGATAGRGAVPSESTPPTLVPRSSGESAGITKGVATAVAEATRASGLGAGTNLGVGAEKAAAKSRLSEPGRPAAASNAGHGNVLPGNAAPNKASSGNTLRRPPPAETENGSATAAGGPSRTAAFPPVGLPPGVRLARGVPTKRSGSSPAVELGSGPGMGRTHRSSPTGGGTIAGWTAAVRPSGNFPGVVLSAGGRVEPSPLQTIVARAKLLAGPGGRDQFQIRLHPPQLGRVAIDLAWQQGGVSVTIVVSKEEVRSAIQADLQGLKSSLAAAGVPLTGVTVNLSGEGKGRRPNGEPGGRSHPGAVAALKTQQAVQPFRPFPLAGASVDFSI